MFFFSSFAFALPLRRAHETVKLQHLVLKCEKLKTLFVCVCWCSFHSDFSLSKA